MLTESQIKKFALINDKIWDQELRAREVFSFDEDYCRSKEFEVGDSFYKTGIYKLAPDDEEFFNMNWYISSWIGCDQAKDFHFGYLMHCLLDHTSLKIEDGLAIDDVWIELVFTSQFLTDKNFNSNDDCY